MRTEQQLRDALDVIAARAPDAEDVLARFTVPSPADPTPRTRRPNGALLRTGQTLVVVAAVMVAAVVGTHLIPRVLSDPADRRVPGYFAMVSRLAPPPGWTVDSREVSGTSETTAVIDPTGKGVCTLEVDGRGAALQHRVPADSEPVTVGGHPGHYYQIRSDTQVELSWPYSPGAWASITCGIGPVGLGGARSPGEIRDLVVGLAQSVAFGEYPVHVPIRIGRLPEGYHVTSVREDQAYPSTDWGVTISPTTTTTTAPDIGLAPSLGDQDQPNSHVQGYPAILTTQPVGGAMKSPGSTNPSRAEVSVTSLCVPTAPIGFCVSTENIASDDPASRYAVFHEVASHISYAASPDDTTTWFDATTAFPS